MTAFLPDLAILLVASLCTILVRALPFVLFGRSGSPGRTVLYLGRVLPAAVMAILVVYCLRSTAFTSAAGFVPQLAACLLVAALLPVVWALPGGSAHRPPQGDGL